MSRCRRDDGRFQSPGFAEPQPPRQGSPYRQYGPPSVARFHGPTVVGGQTYFRSKAKDRDRAGYIAKDRLRNTSTAEIQGHNSAQEKSLSGRSPKLNNEDSAVVAARELSWADEVELMLPNSAAAQGLNVNSTGDERVKLTNAVEHDAVGMKTTAVSNDLNQKIMGESEERLSKAVNAYPSTEHINGKIRQQIERDDDDAAYGKRVNCPQPRRGSRKKTLSLNPEEREALENLIEEVLMDGAIDSDSASSDDDAERSESWKIASAEGQGGTRCETASAAAGREEGDQKMRSDKGKMGRKYYPGQLKVALKHMTELPPRFSRKLKRAEKYLELNMMHDSITATGRIEEEDEESVAAAREEKLSSFSPRLPERDKEKAKQKEHQAKEFKRSIRTLLRDHNQYAEDCGALNSSSIHPPGAIICEDLERETLNMQGVESSELASNEVPSNVQNLMHAAEAISTADENLLPEDIFLENEAATRNFIGASDLVHHSYASLYAAHDPHGGGGQYVMNVPEFIPATMVPAYSPEILRPDHQQQHVHHQYAAAMYIDQSLGAVSGSGIEPASRQGLLSSEGISVVGQVSPNFVPSSSVPSELMSGKMIEFSAAVPPPSMALRTSLAVPMGEKMMSPMTSAYVSNGAQIHMSTMPSSGALPYYQFQGQNIPPPSVSYGFPMQAPYSSNQYCFMPPSLPPQTLPPAYYPQDQSPYSIDAMHLKPVVNPEWNYLKSKQFAENIPTASGYSAYSNLNVAPPIQYPANDPMTSSGANQLSSNFRQRKKQLGSNVSPRTTGNSSSIGSSGKLLNQRTRQAENLPGTLRTGHRMGQEVMPSSVPMENGQAASVFGESSLKRMQLNVRNRGFGDGSSGYLGRRENRNFASEKYSSQRTFGSDGKKEGRHVALKPKQAKPNQSAARSRNDVIVAQLHSGKAYHASDLSEEGLESPDNFGDIESGADDWSTDNYDQEVSRKSKQGNGSDTNDESKSGTPENRASVTQDVVLEISEEIYVPLVKEIPFNDQENRTGKRESECPAEQVVTANVDRKVWKPVDGESTIAGLQRSSDVRPAVGKDILHVSEVDRSNLVVENVKKVAEVQARLRLSVCYEDVNYDKANSLNLQPAVEAVASSICSVEESTDGTFMTKEPSEEVIEGDAVRYSEASSIDMELIDDDAIETDQSPDVNLTGMKLVLGSKFICHLREMFEGCLSTGSSDVCLPVTVCLSHSLLTQLHKEILSQVNLPSNSQTLMGKKSFGEVETQETLDLSCDFHAINATSLTKEELANKTDSNEA